MSEQNVHVDLDKAFNAGIWTLVGILSVTVLAYSWYLPGRIMYAGFIVGTWATVESFSRVQHYLNE